MASHIETLAGLRVLITRPAEQAGRWAESLRRAGALPLVYPVIEVQPPSSWEALDEALANLDRYQWIVFTSAAAVRFTASRMPDPRLLSHRGRKVAAVGAETERALQTLGVSVSVRPAEQRGEGLANELSHLSPATRVLFPQAMGGRTELRDALTAQGCTVDVVPASRTVTVRPLPALPDFDVAIFASPSALRAFVAGLSLDVLAGKRLLALGPTTGATATALGLAVEVAATPDVEAVIDLLSQNR